VTLAEHDRVQLIWVLGHMGIDGNEMGREVVIVDWIRRHEEHWKSICGERQAKGFLKKPSVKKLGKCSV